MTIEAIHGSAVDPRVGRAIGERYRVERLIGRGGMSTVYAATDTALGRTVALKIFSSVARGDFDRQSAEIGVLAGLSHPGLVTLYDAFEADDGEGVIVLEFVDGPDLRQRLRQGPLDAGAVRLLGRSIADALAYVHGHGVVHRDVTPANILLPGERTHGSLPVAKLTDFGIARIVDSTRQTSEGSVIGTANYLSPEQALGAAVGPASDVYSLGLVMLEALTGERAFPGTGIEALAARLHRPPAIPETVPAGWRDIIADCVAREPAERPSADDVVRRLRRLGRASASSAAPTTGAAASVDEPTAAMAPSSAPIPSSLAAPSPLAPSLTIEQAIAVDPIIVTAQSRRVRLRGRDDYPGTPRRGPRALVLYTVIGVIIAALSVGLPLLLTAERTAPVEIVEPDYPAVDGTLGGHLELLQRLVSR
ncbi:MAG: protein kinase [Microcella sp.]|uniref:serine/threonine-protein kinase n=1 Tax=Microcella sp. TaxID=1913979 RepID=UPI002728203F|nr:serine/threonine-protein kinase [Microcella sp.]MDO8337374.1 protein kinase [Microcella sp.]